MRVCFVYRAHQICPGHRASMSEDGESVESTGAIQVDFRVVDQGVMVIFVIVIWLSAWIGVSDGRRRGIVLI